ncbi:MAG: HAMP domain-containing sensor histidine kinase [Candidatus Peribacteraceae bacterium]|nr:HAMP domain-containing sensor histidine kinase [Candidatus Peribacteraceae bacterium]
MTNLLPEESPRLGMIPTPRTWVVAVVTLLTIVGIGAFLYVHSRRVLDGMIKERLQDVASIAASEFLGEEVERIHSREDMEKPLFTGIVRRLRDIREQVPGVRFVYILRRTATPDVLEFVADADSLQSFEEADVNKNGVLDAEEEISYPGDHYSIADIPALQEEAFLRPTTDAHIVHDQWGYTISGYAPIRMKSGKVVAVLGIDMTADAYARLVQGIFSVESLLLLLFGGLLIALYIILAENKRRVRSLEQLTDERSWLMQLILHQVGMPLTIFKWSLESLQDVCRQEKNQKAEVRENLTMMEEGIARLEHVTDVLLAADRVQAGKFRLEPERFLLRGLLESVVASLEPHLKRRQQRVDILVEEDVYLKLDRKLMSGVLREVLDNAITYSPTNGTIAVHGHRHLHHVEIRVVDSGSGIPKDDMSRIFHQFARGSNSSKYDPNGTGVGLYIARGIVERCGGSIHAESEEGRGTTITITLPLR